MSATELIKQVAALPPQERRLFEQLLQAMQNGDRAPRRLANQNGPTSANAYAPFMEKRLRLTRSTSLMTDAVTDDGRLL